jgi:hypothetical protein
VLPLDTQRELIISDDGTFPADCELKSAMDQLRRSSDRAILADLLVRVARLERRLQMGND